MELIKVDLGTMAKSISETITAAIGKEGNLADIHARVTENLQKFIVTQSELEQKNELLINLLSNLMLTVYGFYFGGRSAEKISSMLINVMGTVKGSKMAK